MLGRQRAHQRLVALHLAQVRQHEALEPLHRREHLGPLRIISALPPSRGRSGALLPEAQLARALEHGD
eukprot:3683037-Rhodomonas_salina.1